jgi:hypothetical protein
MNTYSVTEIGVIGVCAACGGVRFHEYFKRYKSVINERLAPTFIYGWHEMQCAMSATNTWVLFYACDCEVTCEE